MIYVTGDTHGDEGLFRAPDYVTEQFSANDKLIICGDFGYVFSGSEREEQYLNYLAKKPFQILFVDGNHENFDLLSTYQVEMWCGGNVHILRRDGAGEPKIIHLMRGQVFQIENKTIFTFGGAYSIDKYMRTLYVSWWPQEMPTEEEMNEAVKNLNMHHNQVDYIITHTAPEDTMIRFHPDHYDEKPLNNFLEWVRENVQYNHWYFGHLHIDKVLWREQTALFKWVRNIETNEIINSTLQEGG